MKGTPTQLSIGVPLMGTLRSTLLLILVFSQQTTTAGFAPA